MMGSAEQVLGLYLLMAKLKAKLASLLGASECQSSLQIFPGLHHRQISYYNQATENALLLYLYLEYNQVELELFVFPSSCSWAPQSPTPFSPGPTPCGGADLLTAYSIATSC